MSKIKKSTEIVEKENVIQAILVADNFNSKFAPITQEHPVALLPLVNIPLIDYSLKCLSLGGVEETFLFCCSHADQIKQHIKNSIEEKAGWSVAMKINIIVSETCRSFGDALRDLDAKGLIRGDFILLNADTVSNIDFLPVLQIHNANVKRDKGAAMTLILQNCGSRSNHRKCAEDVLLVSDSYNRILFHHKIGISNHSKIDFPLEIFLINPRVTIHNQLRDTHIAICSPSVLPLFSDNFDFQTHDDFVRGILMNEEILASSLYWHELKGNQYACRITNWNMYQAVSRDVIHRWTYPLVPDAEISARQHNLAYLRNNVYRHKDVKLAKNCEILEDVVIAAETSIADWSEISRSVIGERCKIGKNVKIHNSYVMANTKIDDNSVVSFSFIGPKCVLGKNVKVTAGSVLGEKVKLQNKEFLENTIVQSTEPQNFEPADKVGPHAYKVRCVFDDEKSDEEEDALVKQLSHFHVNADLIESDEESEVSSNSDDRMSHMVSPVPDDTNLFLSEVIDSLARGFEDKLQCDNLILEINSSRYAYNVSLGEVNYNVVKAILNLPFQQFVGQPSQYYSSLRSLLAYFTPILTNYIRNGDSMSDCLLAIEDVAGTCSEFSECVSKILHWLYEKDYLTEESILKWHSKLETNSRLYTRTSPFVQWLQEADEESGSESE